MEYRDLYRLAKALAADPRVLPEHALALRRATTAVALQEAAEGAYDAHGDEERGVLRPVLRSLHWAAMQATHVAAGETQRMVHVLGGLEDTLADLTRAGIPVPQETGVVYTLTLTYNGTPHRVQWLRDWDGVPFLAPGGAGAEYKTDPTFHEAVDRAIQEASKENHQ